MRDQSLRHTINSFKIKCITILTAISITWPFNAMGDHVPGNLPPELTPNYIGCMLSVDDATMAFRSALQSTCIGQMGNICARSETTELSLQAIDCLYSEVQRAIVFLASAANDLPQEVEQKGFFGNRYQHRRTDLLKRIADLQSQTKPTNSDLSIEQTVAMGIATITLFWLARETGTPLDAHAKAASRED